MTSYNKENIGNIKTEADEQFLIFCATEKRDENEVETPLIRLRKFDKNWKHKAKLFSSYFVCKKCGNVSVKTCCECSLQNGSEEIVGNIKQEPERHFLIILTDNPAASREPAETKRSQSDEKIFSIKSKKFDEKWKRKAELFASYLVCEYFDFARKNLSFRKPRERRQCGFCDQKFLLSQLKVIDLNIKAIFTAKRTSNVTFVGK